MILKSVNYLHFGDALEMLPPLVDIKEGLVDKTELIDLLVKKYKISPFSVDLIQGYNSEYTSDLSVHDFKKDLLHSIKVREEFKKLNCRGFSYQVISNFKFNHKLSSTINFKLALLSDKNLYYPPRLRRYLPRWHYNHIRIRKCPSIAFALGQQIDDELYVIIMQSDLFFNGPPCIREYLKGWRKILFSEILNYCEGKINHLYLTTSGSIVKTCHPDFKVPEKVPEIWFHIYDQTAANFKMELVKTTAQINIQVLKNLSAEYSDKMFYLKII